ncbi:hypothetical protein Tco_1478740, partial [Tanacetum coccineum]
LAFFQETKGPYHTNLPTPDDIHQFLQLERVESNRTIKNKNVILTPNQILTKELRQDMKRWEEFIRENVFGLGGHRDHLPASLAHMVMRPLALKQTQKPQSDHGMPKACYSVSSSSAHRNGSSSHHGDDDEDDDASRASTPSPTTILTPFHHSITKNTTFPPLLNKMMIFSSSDKPLCSIKCKNCMRKLEEVSSHSERH